MMIARIRIIVGAGRSSPSACRSRDAYNRRRFQMLSRARDSADRRNNRSARAPTCASAAAGSSTRRSRAFGKSGHRRAERVVVGEAAGLDELGDRDAGEHLRDRGGVEACVEAHRHAAAAGWRGHKRAGTARVRFARSGSPPKRGRAARRRAQARPGARPARLGAGVCSPAPPHADRARSPPVMKSRPSTAASAKR